MNKDRYTVIFFCGDVKQGNKGFIKWRNITNLNRLRKSIITRYPNAKWMRVYSKNTREQIEYTTF